MRRLIEVEPGRFRFVSDSPPPARSSLPMPAVIGDEMPPAEQVDGHFYTSKSAFRRVGRENGLTEVGTEKHNIKKMRSTDLRQVRKARRDTVGRAIAEHKAGRRPAQTK